jgi:hypothetical protein
MAVVLEGEILKGQSTSGLALFREGDEITLHSALVAGGGFHLTVQSPNGRMTQARRW